MRTSKKTTRKTIQTKVDPNLSNNIPKISGNNIKFEGNVFVKGDVVAGDKIINSSPEINQAFEKLRLVANRLLAQDDRQDALDAVNKLELEAKKGDGADDKKVERWFNFLAGMSEDVWDVLITTFSNPILGISTVFQKIALKVKESPKV